MCSCRGKRHRMARKNSVKKNNANKRAKTSSDYSINSINSSLNSLNSSLNRLNLDRYNSSSERTSERYSSTSSILGSSSSSLTGRTVDRLTGSTHRRLPPLESSNALGSSSIIYPSSGSELRSSRSVRSSISSRNTYDKYSSNYESMLPSNLYITYSNYVINL